MMEWMYLPRPWQVAVWGAVLDPSKIWVCPNVWHTAAARAEQMRDRNEGLEAWDIAVHGSEEEPTIEGLAWTALYHWRRAINGRSINQVSAPTACEPGEWRCSICGGGMEYQLRQFSHVCQPGALKAARDRARLAHPSGSGRMGTEMARSLPLGGAEDTDGSPVPDPDDGSPWDGSHEVTLEGSPFGPHLLIAQVNERLGPLGLRWDGADVSRVVDARA
jgi:hypothetical protein